MAVILPRQASLAGCDRGISPPDFLDLARRRQCLAGKFWSCWRSTGVLDAKSSEQPVGSSLDRRARAVGTRIAGGLWHAKYLARRPDLSGVRKLCDRRLWIPSARDDEFRAGKPQAYLPGAGAWASRDQGRNRRPILRLRPHGRVFRRTGSAGIQRWEPIF